MNLLVLKAYFLLALFDFQLRYGSFTKLHRKVRTCPLGENKHSLGAVRTLCSAVDVACIWYPKKVLCLQRSAATVSLLKRYGVPAQMVIGAQHTPFKAHAWVEVDGRVVNDKPHTPKMYEELDRC